MLSVTERIPCEGLFESDDCDDVTGAATRNTLSLVGIHLVQAADALRAMAADVVSRIPLIERAGIHTQVG